MTTQKPSSAFFMTIFLSFSRDLIAFHSSWDKLECLTGLSITVKSSFPTLLRKTSRRGSPFGGLQDDLVWDEGFSLKFGVTSLQKCYLILILRQNSPKSDLNLSWFLFVWVQNLNLSPRPWFHYQKELCYSN